MFREYDIRGRVNDEELNEQSVEIIGKAYGTLMINENQISMGVVGYDSRKCSPDFRDALVRGLNSVGFSVMDIGMVTTPVFYFSQYLLGIYGGVMITGSHNPDGWSGFKMADGLSSTFLSDDIQKVYEIADAGKFNSGHGEYFRIDDIKSAYVAALKCRVKPEKRLKIVIDAGNGVAGAYAPPLFRAAGFEVVESFCELDPSFPHHFPNPSDLASLEVLRNKTLEHQADLGIAIDGDGDRLGVVDEKGDIIPSDRILLLLARQILDRKPGAKIVFDVKCSNALIEDIKKHGGVPVMWKTGHSFIKRKIKEEKAAIGGEHSGHIFIVDNYYAFDDALFAGLRLAEYLSLQSKPLSSIMKTTKHYLSSPNIQVHCPDDKKYSVVKGILEEFKKEVGADDVIDINGVRVNLLSGWGLIRASSNLPALVIMLEAENEEDYLAIKRRLKEKLEKFPEVDKEWQNDIDPF